jgi:glutaredoxin
MTLFTKRNCALCDQLKTRFDLAAMDVKEEVLDNSPEALAHLAWHSLVETARRTLPILVLDDSSSVSDYTNIEHLLAARAGQYGVGYLRVDSSTGCETGSCRINN